MEEDQKLLEKYLAFIQPVIVALNLKNNVIKFGITEKETINNINIWGYHQYNKNSKIHTIKITKTLLNSKRTIKIIETLAHELRHAWQCYITDDFPISIKNYNSAIEWQNREQEKDACLFASLVLDLYTELWKTKKYMYPSLFALENNKPYLISIEDITEISTMCNNEWK